MELNKDDAAVCADSIDAPEGTSSAGEIDLYEELNAFAELSPEEQLRLVDQGAKTSAELEKVSADSVAVDPSPEAVPTLATIDPDEPQIAASETSPTTGASQESASAQTVTILIDVVDETKDSSSGPVEEPSSAEPVVTPAPSELVGAETILAEAPVTPDAGESETATTLGSVETQSPSEPSRTDTTVPDAEPPGSAVLTGSIEPADVRPMAAAGPRPSGPLSGFNLPPEIVYTGALSRGVCLSCGAESGADDLFCMTCGVFIDEIASTIPSSPECGECKQTIEADEIFCPWCGSAVTS